MVQIIEENRPKSFREQLLTGAGRAASEASTEIPKFFGHKMLEQERKARQVRENQQLSELVGQDISGIQDQNIKKAIVENLLKSKAPIMEKIAPLQTGLQTIKRMRELGEGGRLGKTLTRGIFGGQQAKERGEYEQLGKSLISLASTIPIRNQMEFETLSSKLYDPSLLDSEREGVLNAMERIITQSLQQYGTPTQTTQPTQPQVKERPPLSSFHR